MVEVVKSVSAVAATCSEFTAVVVIVVGAIQVITSAVIGFLRAKTPVVPLALFRNFAGWLVLALEFLLAADILKSAISQAADHTFTTVILPTTGLPRAFGLLSDS